MVHKLIEQQRHQAGRKLSSVEQQGAVVDDASMVPITQAEPQIVQSRLLTKRQLANMAMGIRSLAKKLGSLRVKLNIRTVFLVTKIYDRTLIAKTRDVVRWLLSPERDAPYVVWVEDVFEHDEAFDVKSLLEEDPSFKHRLRYWNSDMTNRQPHAFDFVVTLGGDGTVLYASWLFQHVVPPVLSFALGSLGFLTRFDFAHFQDILTKAFRDGVTISLRLRFEATVMRSQPLPHHKEPRDLVEELIGDERGDDRTHKPGKTYEILNDVVMDRGPNPSKLITSPAN